jgi:putative nucleotidyltransferase with HDIG domain
MDRIDQFLDTVQTLPASPRPLPELLRALTEVDSDINRVAELIAVDPALTAKLLRTCTSAFFGLARPADDVAEAVSRLGFRTVFRVVSAVRCAYLLRPAAPSYGVDPDSLWRHSVTTAFAAQFIAEDSGAEGGLFFTAGLLHDIGKLVLAEAYKADYGRLVIEAQRTGRRLYELEQAAYGMDHAEIGGRLLTRWNFSPQLANSVGFHHRPAGAESLRRFAAQINLANTVAHNTLKAPAEAATGSEPPTGLIILGLTQEDLARYLERIEQNLAMVELMCGVSG